MAVVPEIFTAPTTGRPELLSLSLNVPVVTVMASTGSLKVALMLLEVGTLSSF